MRRTLAILIVVLVGTCGGSSHAQHRVTFETITFSDTATGFTSTTIRPSGDNPMTQCVGKLETAQIRFRFDGTSPTSAVGSLADIGDVVTVSGLAYLSQFKGIRTGDTSGVIAFHCTR
jgi:hypothetical protein